MGFQSDLLEGFAQLLANAGVGAWSPAGTYGPGVTGIVLHKLPDLPDRVIVLAAYVVADDPSLSDSTLGLQVRTRMDGQDPRPTDDLSDLVFDQIQGREGYDLPTGIRVVQSLRQSGDSLGQDDSRRWVRSDNYHVDAHRPSPHRT